MNKVFAIASMNRSANETALSEIAEFLATKPSEAEVCRFIADALAGYDLATLGMAAQRIRRARERILADRVAFDQRHKLLARAIKAYDRICAYCEQSGDRLISADGRTHDLGPDGKKWELDRILPGRLGGSYAAANVALSCHTCNQKKLGNFTMRPPLSLADRAA